MTIRIVKGTPPSPIGHLVVDYLASCQARGLVPRSLKQYPMPSRRCSCRYRSARRPDERSSDAIFLTHRRGRLGQYESLSTEGVYRVVKEAVERARITKRVYTYLLRHSFMTEMLRCDMNVVQLSFIAGASPEAIR